MIKRNLAFAAALGLLGIWGRPASAEPQPQQPTKTFSFVVVSLFTSIYETPTLDECPAGLAETNDQIWWKGLSPHDRIKPTEDGDREPAARFRTATERGPHGEDVCWNPTLVQDPPQRTVQGKISYGIDLDGTTDGHKTAASCAHQKFTSPDGAPGVDNQLYRIVGCIHGWRSDGFIETNANSDHLNNSKGTTLIEVTGTGDLPRNGDVEVHFYKAADNLPKDSTGKILPYASYRIDNIPLYGATAHGTIKDGLLTTDPADVRLPYFGNNQETNFFIRGLRLRLNIQPDGSAKGIIAGYHDLDNWWDYVSKSGYLVGTGHFDCPSLYVAAHQMADGYPDPKTGECTALSAAYNVEAVPAFVVHDDVKVSDKPLSPVAGDLARQGAPGAAMPHEIATQETLLGKVLTDLNGMTLYTNDGDTPNSKSGCTGDCRATWRAVAAPETGLNLGDWSVVHRADDATAQWAFQGKPLYTYVKDIDPGDTKGDGANKVWHAALLNPAPAAPPWLTVQNSDLGRILADAQGKTIYAQMGKMPVILRQICDDACMKQHWVPLYADADAQPVGRWALIALDDGKKQWSFMGNPLYSFLKDTGPAQIGGNHFGGASVGAQNYFIAIPEAALMGGELKVSLGHIPVGGTIPGAVNKDGNNGVAAKRP